VEDYSRPPHSEKRVVVRIERALKIYIAGPYTARTAKNRLANVNLAIDAGIALFLKGHFPYIPHLTHFVDTRALQTRKALRWEDYLRWDLVWLRECDALLLLGHSRGADLELREAKRLRKSVFLSIDEIQRVVLARDVP
jgi:hypothetical protein